MIKMKINARDRIIIVITTCMLLSSVIFSAANSSDTNSNRKRELITHEPIYIDGNDDFVIGENGVVSGSGTQDDPFLISGWDINASTAHGIHILNTDVYFIVRGCYIHDGNDTDYYGILLEYVENGRVDTVSSTRNRRGIVLGEKSKEIAIANSSFNHNAGGISCHGPWMSGDEGCSFIHVINNTVSHNQYIGISCYGRDSTIEGNTITYNYHGIHSGDGGEEYGGNVAYINNTISYNAGNGIVFDHNHENIIMGNIITYNGYDPIPMYQNDEDTHGGLWLLCWEYHVDVIDNTICFNYGRGLLFSSAEECRVLNNTITQNYGDGVLLRRAGQYPNSMYHNMIAQNTKNGILISEEHGRVKNFNIAYNMIRDNGEYGFYCNASSLFWPPNLIHHNLSLIHI